MAISLFGQAASPADNGTQAGSSVTITPPASMIAGDVALVVLQTRDTSFQGSTVVTTAGGQLWQRLTSPSTLGVDVTTVSYQVYACRFNGTWGTNPIFDNGGSAFAMTGVMLVWRPTTGKVLNLDVEPNQQTFTGASPTGKTNTGITTANANALAIAVWMSIDDNTWNNLTAGWSQSGLSAQYRNLSGNDQSMAIAYKAIAVAGAVGSVAMDQATLGGDAGVSIMLSLFEHDPPPAGGITSDSWSPFEFATLNTSNLDADDHTADFTWSITDAGGTLSTNATGEQALLGTVNGVSDTGTRGIKQDLSNGSTQFGILRATFATTHTNGSLGFWFSGPDMRGTFGEFDIGVCGGVGGDGGYLKMGDDRYTSGAYGMSAFRSASGHYAPSIPLVANTKYWITALWQRNATTTLRVRVFDTSGNQVGFDSPSVAIDEPWASFDIGSQVTEFDLVGANYWDDLVVDYTDATFPLFPLPGGAAAQVPYQPAYFNAPAGGY